MKIKRYEGKTEEEVLEKVKNELGLNALILNIRKTQPRGMFSFMSTPHICITAVKDEKRETYNFSEFLERWQQGEKISSLKSSPYEILGNKLPYYKHEDNSLVPVAAPQDVKHVHSHFTHNPCGNENNIYKEILFSSTINIEKEKIKNLEKTISELHLINKSKIFPPKKYENELIQLFYEALSEQGVLEEIIEKILYEVVSIDNDNIDLEDIVKIIYNNIINILGIPEAINLENTKKNKPKIITFIGPTGVGKTTTIAKLSSIFLLEYNKTVGFITADTYRIAAVDQLKTYAEILGTDMGVAYNHEDLLINIRKFSKKNEILIIDTAGISHKNEEGIEELSKFLESIPQSEKFLVLSVTTKYEDLLNIVKVYSEITDFKIIFTKLDETLCFGSILNICYATGKKISYMATGQNVPDDIEVIKPEKIAKILMGLGGIKNHGSSQSTKRYY